MSLEASEHWEEKAIRARALAERMTEAATIEVLLEIAAYYDMLASYSRAEESLSPLH